jgi:hypothetical protein
MIDFDKQAGPIKLLWKENGRIEIFSSILVSMVGFYFCALHMA